MQDCSHSNTTVDPVARTVSCVDCGKVVARFKPKVKKMIKARRPKRG